MRKVIAILALLILLSGCATVRPAQIMVNPETGQRVLVETHAWGWGIRGAIAHMEAQRIQKERIEYLKTHGFIEVESLGQ